MQDRTTTHSSVIPSEVRRGGRSRGTCSFFPRPGKTSDAPSFRAFCEWMGSKLLITILSLTPALAAQQSSTSPADAKNDPVLSAMLAELDRSRQQLQLPGFEKPYFIEYHLDDVAEYEATAAWGTQVAEHEMRSRIVRVTVRVGDYKLDSSGARSDASIEISTIENDPMALRYALWSATDAAYKNALNSYTAKQAALKSVQTLPQADDFSREKPVVSIAPIARSEIDRAAWKQHVIEATGLYRTDDSVKGFAAEIQSSEGSLESRLRTQYIVNTEGTIVRKSMVEYRAEVLAQTQAPDGMRLERSWTVSGLTPSDLGSPDKFLSGVLQILTGLHDLRDAPVVSDEYHGPVLFAGSASAHLFDDLFARAIAGRRPQLGSTSRTIGPFASSYQTRVLPDFFRVIDNPGITSFDGKPLLGAYQVDDEGVAAQSVTLVNSGKLSSYLTAREPIRDFPSSNGHGRASAGESASPRIGVLEIQASEAISEDELLKKLLSMGRDQGLEYVYFVETLNGSTRPRTLYRVKVADGSRQLVRGAQLEDVNLHLLRSGIMAAGSDPYVYNTFGDIPSTVIAPPLLFDDVTVKRAEQRNEKLPYYTPPE
ncbi:MAG: peptidase U62 [Silvibacterium sp.]|nr:peptidase U62 [Silvibacterium sp.]